MTRTLLTGGTGYIGGYVVNELLRDPTAQLSLLVRARSDREGAEKLWKTLQLHMDAAAFGKALERIRFIQGDITSTAPNMGISGSTFDRLVNDTTSIVHIAASLNRKSEKACLNTNLRGTLAVAKVGQALERRGQLSRFTHVSTVAVAGHRQNEVVEEDAAIDWERSDYDPYARTKKFAEHMIRELLPTSSLLFLRPSIVMGDSRHERTTQFDMVRAFCMLADLPVVPFGGDGRLDIVNVDFVGKAIAALHTKKAPRHRIYHLSAGRSALTAKTIAEAITHGTGRRAPRFINSAEPAFRRTVNALARSSSRNAATQAGSLLAVFLPYITFNTVFDNTRVTTETGLEPVPFVDYCVPLYRFAKRVQFNFPYAPTPTIASRAFEQAESASL